MRAERWETLVSTYRNTLTNGQHDVERALFLQRLAREKPWTQRARYALKASYLANKDLTWHQVVTNILDEDRVEVDNTIHVVQTFGPQLLQTWGRTALVRAYNRTVRGQALPPKALLAALKEHGGKPTVKAMQKILSKVAPLPKKTGPTVKELQDHIDTMKGEMASLIAENTRLRTMITNLEQQGDTAELQALITSLKRDNEALKHDNEVLSCFIADNVGKRDKHDNVVLHEDDPR